VAVLLIVVVVYLNEFVAAAAQLPPARFSQTPLGLRL